MRAAQTSSLLLICLGLAALTACHKQSDAKTEGNIEIEFYTPVDGAVGFNILPAQSMGGSHAWLASFTDESGTTKFQIDLSVTTASGGSSSLDSSGHGTFLSQPGSDPLPLLQSLKTALKASRMPANVEKVDQLSFDYTVLGENQSRSASGTFSSNPPGHWTTLKVFFPQSREGCEVLLNINEAAHQAEFSIKNPAYGNAVLGQLAKVF